MSIRSSFVVIPVALLAACTASPRVAPQTPATDPYLAHLVGDWHIERTIRGETVTNDMHVEPVLGGAFVRLHMVSTTPDQPYEAIVLLGFDPDRTEYVAHWCDSFGPGYSALGKGKRQGSRVELVFAYPDGPFFNTLDFDESSDSWTFTGESSAPGGTRKLFAHDVVTRRR